MLTLVTNIATNHDSSSFSEIIISLLGNTYLFGLKSLNINVGPKH